MLCENCFEAVCDMMPLDRETAAQAAAMMGTEIPDHICYDADCVCSCVKQEEEEYVVNTSKEVRLI